MLPQEVDAIEQAIGDIAHAIREVFISPNVLDTNGESANIVDALDTVGRRLRYLDDIGVGLIRIAESLDNLASAVREKG